MVGFAALTTTLRTASGHSTFEPENVDALVRATDKFAA
jgi:hypothetical protein